jgi:hypothetical protein
VSAARKNIHRKAPPVKIRITTRSSVVVKFVLIRHIDDGAARRVERRVAGQRVSQFLNLPHSISEKKPVWAPSLCVDLAQKRIDYVSVAQKERRPATVSRSAAGDLSRSLGRLIRGETGGSRTLGAFGE